MDIKQRLILRKLVAMNGQRYSELFQYFSYEDKFPYHLKYLLTKGLIRKREGKYFLTKEGMKVTANFDSRTLEETKGPDVMFLFVCQRDDKFLLQEHFSNDKNPERRVYFLMFAKPQRGLLLAEGAKIEFKRKYGVEVEPVYRSTYHQIHRTTDGDVLFDDIWLVFDVPQFSGETKGFWATREGVAKLENVHPFIKTLIADNRTEAFLEDEIVLNYGVEVEDL